MKLKENEKSKLESYRLFLNIIDYIKKQGHTAREISFKMGIQEVTMSRYINGVRYPSHDFVMALSNAYNVPNDVLKDYFGNVNDDTMDVIRTTNFSEQIRNLKSLGITQREIAKEIGVTEVSISRYIKENRKPRSFVARKLYCYYKKVMDDNLVEEQLNNSFFEEFKKLPLEDKKVLINIAKSLQQKNEIIKKKYVLTDNNK